MGLRLGEVLGLRWMDVDLESKTVHVRHSLQRIAGKLVLAEPKTKGSERSVKLPAMAYTALQEHRKGQHEIGLVTPYVFATWKGTPIDPRNALRRFKELLAKAGLPDSIRFHDLRHSSATLLLIRGATYEEVAEMLGHSNSAMLHRTYSAVLPHRRELLANMMDEVLGI